MIKRTSACIITNNEEILFGNENEQHRDLIFKNNLKKDEDIIGYYDYYSPNVFIPNPNYYLFDEERCDKVIDKYLLEGGNNV